MRGGVATVTGIALALAAPAAASAQGGASYGGATLVKGQLGASVSLTLGTGGRVDARVGRGYNCRRANFVNVVTRLGGVVQGSALTASGSTRLTRRGRVRVRMRGTLAGDRITGRISYRPSRLRSRGCPRYSRRFVLRAERVPAGAPARPAGGTRMHGLTGQAAGGIRLPVSLHVLRGGRRLVALWQANMRCGPRAVFTAVNFTPPTRVRRDGTFVRHERYRIRFGRGLVETFRVVIRGRFLADGAVGTLRARKRIRQPGRRFYPCDSGVQRWTASP